ncbi:hypothetical protein [Streptomyces sp. NPDC097610]
MAAPANGSPEQDRTDYAQAQELRDLQDNRVSGLGYDTPATPEDPPPGS